MSEPSVNDFVLAVENDDPLEFRNEIEEYADSNNESADIAYWPLVKKIKLSGPWAALR